VLSLGSYLIGQQGTPAAARLLANSLYVRDPYMVKNYRTIYARVPWGTDYPVVAQYMPLDQQREVFANRIRNLHQYQFLLRPAVNEGEIGQDVFPLSIRTPDPGQFPDRELLDPLYPMLAARSGTHVDVLIKEQEARLRPAPTQQAPRRQRSPAPESEGAVPERQESTPVPEPPRRTIQRRRLVS
jgi:hypothetical protein